MEQVVNLRVGFLDGEQAHVVSLPFCPQSGMIFLFTPPGKEEQVRFKVDKVSYDCDLDEIMVEGEILSGN